MWIIARILIACSAALYRALFRRIPPTFEGNFQGNRYNYREIKNKQGKITKSYLEFPFDSPLVCCFQPETGFDRLLLSLAIGDEITVNDSRFDEAIYIVGDHPSLARYVFNKTNLRALLLKSVGDWLRSLSITGKTLRFEMEGQQALERILPECIALIEELSDIPTSISSRFADPFYVKALAAESVIWGVFGYALSTIFEWTVYKQDYHLFPSLLILPGLVIAGALLMLGILLLIIFLGRSSRTPRIIGESILLLALALPITGIEAISDINRGLDHSSGTTIVRPISWMQKKYHRTRRSRYYTYHLYFEELSSPQLPGFELPSSMEVDSSIYSAVEKSRKVSVSIAPGYLNIPWYKEIH